MDVTSRFLNGFELSFNELGLTLAKPTVLLPLRTHPPPFPRTTGPRVSLVRDDGSRREQDLRNLRDDLGEARGGVKEGVGGLG